VSPPVQAARNYTHHRHLLLLSTKADTHFTVPQRVEGWVDLAGYIPSWFTRPQTVTHPSTNRVWCSATTLIEANALPLSQIANHKSVTNWTELNYYVPCHTSDTRIYCLLCVFWRTMCLVTRVTLEFIVSSVYSDQPGAMTSFAWRQLAAILPVDIARRLDARMSKRSTKNCVAYGCNNVCDGTTRNAGITFHA